MSRILIIDDDESIRKVLGYMLEEAGYAVDRAESAEAGMAALAAHRPDLVLSDIKMPGKDGIALLADIKAHDASIPVIMLTAFGTVETAVEAMKRGAADYLTKPVSLDELRLTVEKTLAFDRLERENAELRGALHDRFRFENIVGTSEPMQAVFDAIRKVAPTDANVLIMGESGTGKELVARAIHHNSPRRGKRMVTVNCAAIPADLLESDLFGHVRGAFTGAIRDKVGKFELAGGGTIFLDEIGSMPLPLQPKLLRVLQEREIERVGAERTSEVDVRVIAATNRPLAALVARGEFREDLYYRLNVVPVHLPPLREHTSDIPLLVQSFVARIAADAPVHFTSGALAALERYAWPGNVRELENFVERVVLMRSGDAIDDAAVERNLAALERESPFRERGASTLPEIERRAIVDALRASDWNQSRAARRLGIARHVLLYRLRKFAIDIDAERGAAGE
ncbi:MAG: sigma-54 dependent transcriptional regulator [Gemmatimonadota bacterium]|nr:sigma-54 dependent transcriptional regulator [Gemmatimonadota bacterium]